MMTEFPTVQHLYNRWYGEVIVQMGCCSIVRWYDRGGFWLGLAIVPSGKLEVK